MPTPSHMSPVELVDRFVRERDEERECQLATVIRQHADAGEVFDAIGALVRQAQALDRRRGGDLLTFLGSSPQHAPTVARMLLEVLRNEDAPEVLQSVCLAFNRLELPDDSRLLCTLADALAKLEAHPDATVREALAIAFGTHATPHAADVLRRMTSDDDEGVRNWATCGLARLNDADSDAIRSALSARLNEDESEIRAEALFGLARRVGADAEDHLIAELHRSEVHVLVFEAIEQIERPSQRLREALHALLAQKETDGANACWRKRLQECTDVADLRSA